MQLSTGAYVIHKGAVIYAGVCLERPRPIGLKSTALSLQLKLTRLTHLNGTCHV